MVSALSVVRSVVHQKWMCAPSVILQWSILKQMTDLTEYITDETEDVRLPSEDSIGYAELHCGATELVWYPDGIEWRGKTGVFVNTRLWGMGVDEDSVVYRSSERISEQAAEPILDYYGGWDYVEPDPSKENENLHDKSFDSELFKRQ